MGFRYGLPGASVPASIQSGLRLLPRTGVWISILAPAPPFDDEGDPNSDEHHAPNSRQIECPRPCLDQPDRDGSQDENRSGKPAMQRPVTPEVDEARCPECRQQQSVSVTVQRGPHRSQNEAGAIQDHKCGSPEADSGWRRAAGVCEWSVCHKSFRTPDCSVVPEARFKVKLRDDGGLPVHFGQPLAHSHYGNVRLLVDSLGA